MKNFAFKLNFSGDLETEKVSVVRFVHQLSDVVSATQEEIRDYKKRYETLLMIALQRQLEVPPDLQHFVDCGNLV